MVQHCAASCQLRHACHASMAEYRSRDASRQRVRNLAYLTFLRCGNSSSSRHGVPASQALRTSRLPMAGVEA